MLRLTKLANKNLRRTLKAQYAQTQAYPYAALLDPLFDPTAGALAGTNAISGAKAAILPGLVAKKQAGEQVTVSYGNNANQRAFGLFANFVGGDMDELFGSLNVGVWRGAGGVFELLAPAYSDTGLAAEAVAEAGTGVTEVYFDAGTNGQLTAAAAGVKVTSSTARLISRLSANAVIVELLV